MKLDVNLHEFEYPFVIITPVTRLDNLPFVEKSIRMSMEKSTLPIVWWQSHAHFIPLQEKQGWEDGIYVVKTRCESPGIGGTAERNEVLDYLTERGKCRICFLDDDNLMLTSYLETIQFLMKEFPSKGFFYDQVNLDGSYRCIAAPQNVRPCGIDTAQGCIPIELVGDERWNVNSSVNDGEFYQAIYNKKPLEFLFVNRPLCAYNALV
jgi:hypothetical protein